MWFDDLLDRELLGEDPRYGAAKVAQEKQEYLRAWGYGGDDGPYQILRPFDTLVAGLLKWPQEDGNFMFDAQRVAEGCLVPVEPVHAAAVFGLLAVDIFTASPSRSQQPSAS